MRRLILGVVVLAALTVGAASARADDPVFPRGPHPYGVSYNEWALQWWRWVYSIPTAVNPLTQVGDVDCSARQRRHIPDAHAPRVWFLGGVFGVSGTGERSCRVP